MRPCVQQSCLPIGATAALLASTRHTNARGVPVSMAHSARAPVGQCSPAPSGRPVQMLVSGRWQRRASVASSPPVSEASSPSQDSQVCLNFSVRRVTDSAELRAAADLRAGTFYEYPVDRSVLSTRSHRRMKADEHWKALEQKLAGTEPDWKGIEVMCFVAACAADDGSPAARAAARQLDPSCKLPAAGAAPAQLVVGTLDVNIGVSIPSENLVGSRPPGAAARRGRAYLSNVCTVPAAQRQGVATALIASAAGHAWAAGVTDLYVHVAASNAAARQLYVQRCGFDVERRELESVARGMGRPARLLLHRAAPQPDAIARAGEGEDAVASSQN